jgi:hypothetical protein
VVYICGSSAQIARFKELIRRMIFMDNRIRWNSWYKILLVLFNLRPAIKKYCLEYKNELKKIF